MLISFILSSFVLFIIAIAFTFILKSYRRIGISRLLREPALQMENTELLNKLLKQKVAKGETLSDEEIQLAQKIQGNRRNF